jgi:hypothetical protein
MVLTIFSGDIPWNLGLKNTKNRPKIYGIGTSVLNRFLAMAIDRSISFQIKVPIGACAVQSPASSLADHLATKCHHWIGNGNISKKNRDFPHLSPLNDSFPQMFFFFIQVWDYHARSPISQWIILLVSAVAKKKLTHIALYAGGCTPSSQHETHVGPKSSKSPSLLIFAYFHTGFLAVGLGIAYFLHGMVLDGFNGWIHKKHRGVDSQIQGGSCNLWRKSQALCLMIQAFCPSWNSEWAYERGRRGMLTGMETRSVDKCYPGYSYSQ